MKIAIMQNYFFPYLGYFQLLNSCDHFIFYDDVQYIKNGWINRNRVYDGKEVKYITVPVKKWAFGNTINEVYIDRGQDFKNKILSQLKTYYGKHLKKEVYDLIGDTLTYEGLPPEWDIMSSRLASRSILNTCEYLGLKVNTSLCSNFPITKGLKGKNRVIQVVKWCKGDTYINMIGGQELYSKQDFEQEGIELKFLRPNLPEYKGHSGEANPLGLSIIDVLMFNDKEVVKEWLDTYELV